MKDFLEQKLQGVVKKYPSQNVKQKKFRRQLLNIIVRSKWPITFVEDKEVVESYSIADPRLTGHKDDKGHKEDIQGDESQDNRGLLGDQVV